MAIVEVKKSPIEGDKRYWYSKKVRCKACYATFTESDNDKQLCKKHYHKYKILDMKIKGRSNRKSRTRDIIRKINKNHTTRVRNDEELKRIEKIREVTFMRAQNYMKKIQKRNEKRRYSEMQKKGNKEKQKKRKIKLVN